jgi:hypothetical protein
MVLRSIVILKGSCCRAKKAEEHIAGQKGRVTVRMPKRRKKNKTSVDNTYGEHWSFIYQTLKESDPCYINADAREKCCARILKKKKSSERPEEENAFVNWAAST